MAKRPPFQRIYKQAPMAPAEVSYAVEKSVEAGKAFSLVRAGDIVTLILTKRSHLIRSEVFGFLGIPDPVPDELRLDLHQSLATADILGLTEFKGRTGIAEHLKRYLVIHDISPQYVTRPFINDQLYDSGHITRWISRYRTILVGRSAPKAAQNNGLTAITLNSWDEINSVLEQILSQKSDLVLSGAGIPGRILCGLLKGHGRVAVEIGHIMDALAYPHVRRRSKPEFWRRAFKDAYLRGHEPAPITTVPSNNGITTGSNSTVRIKGRVAPDTGMSTKLMQHDRVISQVREATGMHIIPGSLKVNLQQPLELRNTIKWSYGELCPALLNGANVFLNKRPFFRPELVTVISDLPLRAALDLSDKDLVTLEVNPKHAFFFPAERADRVFFDGTIT